MTEFQMMKAHEIALHYGKQRQKMQAVQELSELILVLSRRPDQKHSQEEYLDDLLDEMADCCIMIEQMRQLYDIHPHELERRITAKLNRQLDRMKGGST